MENLIKRQTVGISLLDFWVLWRVWWFYFCDKTLCYVDGFCYGIFIADGLIAILTMQEDGINLLSIIKATSKYRRSKRRDYVKDFLPPSKSEFKNAIKNNR